MVSHVVLILHKKVVVIFIIPFVIILVQNVLPCLGIQVYHKRRGGHSINSTLVDVRPLGAKNHRRYQACKIERGSPYFSYLT